LNKRAARPKVKLAQRRKEEPIENASATETSQTRGTEDWLYPLFDIDEQTGGT